MEFVLLIALVIAMAAAFVVALLGGKGYKERLRRALIELQSAWARALSAERHLMDWTECACTPDEARMYFKHHPEEKVIFLLPAKKGEIDRGIHGKSAADYTETEGQPETAGRVPNMPNPPQPPATRRENTAFVDWPTLLEEKERD